MGQMNILTRHKHQSKQPPHSEAQNLTAYAAPSQTDVHAVRYRYVALLCKLALHTTVQTCAATPVCTLFVTLAAVVALAGFRPQ